MCCEGDGCQSERNYFFGLHVTVVTKRKRLVPNKSLVISHTGKCNNISEKSLMGLEDETSR
jgi:hypothetical protein